MTMISRLGTRDRLSYPALGAGAIVPDIAVFVWQRIPRDKDGEIATNGW
jgi:hypothetical protein